MDFEGFMDGEAFEGGKGENHSLEIGSGQFIPGFEDQLVGKESGEDTEVKLTFPEDSHAEELAGKEATFKVKDRKSTRLNSSHVAISYAVFCLKKKMFEIG